MPIQLGSQGGDCIVTSVMVKQERGEFSRATIEVIFTGVFGVAPLQSIDFSKVFGSPEVTKAIATEIEEQTRKFNFSDQ